MTRPTDPSPTPTRVLLHPAATAELHLRLARTRAAADLGPGWERGTPGGWLAELLADWRDFDVSAFQARLDALDHVRALIGGQELHAVRVPGTGRRPVPLLLAHGWPGSFLEHLALIPLLTDPADGAQSFTLVIPSLPGFGFSGPPAVGGLTARETASLFHALMHDGFGYERYVAHGSDLGAGIVAWMARDHPNSVASTHLATPGLQVPQHDRSEDEERFAEEVADWSAEEGGYLHEHATKPATLAAALSDSPAGLAAWIGEKAIAWSSRRPDGASAFDRERLLETLTLYWATNTIGSSLLPYWAYRHDGGALPADSPSPVPTAITLFGGERVPFPKPPRRLAERYYTVSRWTELPVGGHFPAIAEPQILAAELRAALGAASV